MNQQQAEQAKRSKLQDEKPYVLAKLKRINDRHAQNIATPMIDIAYNFRCNFKCAHCATTRMIKKDRKIDPGILLDLSNQAEALGLCQFVISGGEPLLYPDLEEIFKALQPSKFHIAMSTNGWFMTEEKAIWLKKLGLDKVKISIDDFDEKIHDENRGVEGAYKRALKAMEFCKKAGMGVAIQAVVTHQNCKTDRTIKLAEFAQNMGYDLDIIVARAIGRWEGRHEVLIDQEDADFLWEVHQKYPALHRDTFPTYGMHRGCGCVDSILHVTPYGDVLPCVFIHIAIGNIFEEPLKDIIHRGQHLKPFACFSKLCLSGEDRDFINQYMTKFYGKPIPIPWQEAFTEADIIL